MTDGEIIHWALRRVTIGSCDCNAKGPNPDTHSEHCDYKQIKLAEQALGRLRAVNNELLAIVKQLAEVDDREFARLTGIIYPARAVVAKLFSDMSKGLE